MVNQMKIEKNYAISMSLEYFIEPTGKTLSIVFDVRKSSYIASLNIFHKSRTFDGE